ncbi:MAG: SDR family NAD(P)-dependent oxidoreductase [Microthrixaceae bacterium]
MDLRLDGKVALVTGGSKGIGKAIASAYAEAGARALISSRKSDREGARPSPEIRSVTGAQVEVYAANAGDPDAAAACVAHTIETLGGLDILVNNAATNPYMGQMIDIDLPRLDKTYDVNLRGVFVWIQEPGVNTWHRAAGT